ncbi:hypothetical protein F2Q69_00058915 [Brassica cretica]|uniref:Uncharacterized protein n=1 Tax=Brassica cretica TaxID=69181 RepID=A0A8S9RDQ3_BRACR|nr:hypothetical protein F2Q69_00058915 [Brassica cretica]
MISECGSEVERLPKELEESREKSSQLKWELKVIEDAHSLEAARFESRIGELERDLGKTASSFLKAKVAKTAKSSELRRLKRKVKSGAESSICAIREAKEAMRAEFQTHLATIADSLDSSAAIHVRDLALACVEGGTNEVGEAPLSPQAEEATLPSECILPSCPGEPEGQYLVAEDSGGSTTLNPEGATGEGEAPRAEDD